MKDARGVDINPGDSVVWACYGANELIAGTVVRLTAQRVVVRYTDTWSGRDRELETHAYPHRVAVVERL